MPLQTTALSASALAHSLEYEAQSSQKPVFLVVYAGLINGRSWCGDCRQAEPFVKKKFVDKNAKVVYAGDPSTWRKSDNPWRQPPFNVTNLPTIMKVTSDGKWHKLVEADVYDQNKLDSFVD